MTKSSLSIALLLGSSIVLWMTSIFIGADALALTVTMLIGFVLILGVAELYQFRQETFQAQKVRAQTMPEIAEKLSAMVNLLETVSERLGENLETIQYQHHHQQQHQQHQQHQQFQKTVQSSFSELTSSINSAFKNTVDDHDRLIEVAQPLLQSLADRFATTSETAVQAWQVELSKHESANKALLDALGQKVSSWLEQQSSNDEKRLEHWTDTLGATQQQAVRELADIAERYSEELKSVSDQQQASIQTVTRDFESLSYSLSDQWQRVGQQSLSEQHALTDALNEAARSIGDAAQNASHEILTKIAELLQSSEQLIQARISSEQSWLERYEEHMKELTVAIKTELATLKSAEEQHTGAAVERLSQLQSAVAEHLATLSKELEAPIARLIEAASETPRAAAQVIEQLRHEISSNNERDNQLLEERRHTLEQLNALFKSLAESSVNQRKAMEELVNLSADMLKDVGIQFTDHLDTQASKLTDSIAQIASCTTDISSFGDAFGMAVELFNQSNENLIEHLNRIEQALEQSRARSNEQLGYYVAQAREIIDHSLLSQQQLLETLRDVGR